MSNLGGRNIWGATYKEMHMIFLYVESAYRPGVGSSDAADLLFDKCCYLISEDTSPVLGTPDEVIG